MRFYFKCPKCKQDKVFYRVNEDDTAAGCFILLTGGLIASMLYGNRQARRVQCGECSYIFVRPGLAWSKIAVVFLFMALGTSLFFLYLAYAYAMPGLERTLPWYPAMDPVFAFVESHPRAVAYGLAVYMPVTLLLALIGMSAANGSLRRRLAAKYLTEPMQRVRPGSAEGGDTAKRQQESPGNETT